MAQQQAARKNLQKKSDLKEFAYEFTNIITHHFPDLDRQLSAVADSRKAWQYTISEIVFGAIAMFVFKSGSRNNMNNVAGEGEFKKNFYKAFKFRIPHMDSITLVFKEMPIVELEKLKLTLVKQLMEKKVFDKWRFEAKVIVAIDATGLVNFKEKHCDKCLFRIYKANEKRKVEKIVYFHNVLEAKLVTKNGFSISLCTEWIENDGTEYDKQDCESKAFVRLSEKLKKDFPRMAICLCADGLYPNNTFFEICKKYNWSYIVTLPDKSLKRLWKKIRETTHVNQEHQHTEGPIEYVQKYQYINDIEHNGLVHNWIQTDETQTTLKGKITVFKFVHLTNIEISQENARDISTTGRLRWKIEKQGFDQQKNHGYNISHKYCRKSYKGMKNYYQCCQIAHIFNQLVELSKNILPFKPAKTTIKHIWFCLCSFMIYGDIQIHKIEQIINHRTQIQYVD